MHEATEMAKRIHADGIALYEIQEKKWVELFDLEGQTIYHACRISTYGSVSCLLKLNIDKILSIFN